MPFKAIVMATCLAVLSAIGYYFWREHEAHQENARYQRIAEARAGCIALVERLIELPAKLVDGEIQKPGSDALRAEIMDCSARGLISGADINAISERYR